MKILYKNKRFVLVIIKSYFKYLLNMVHFPKNYFLLKEIIAELANEHPIALYGAVNNSRDIIGKWNMFKDL